MVEVVVAVGLGGLLAYLLSGPLAGASASQPPPAPRSKQPAPPEGKLTASAGKVPPAPLVAPASGTPGAPAAGSPRKATQTAHKFK